MTNYRTFFIPSERQVSKKKMDLYTMFRVDGLDMSSKIQALLVEYEQLGYDLSSINPVQSTVSGMTYTEGMLIVLHKKS